MEHFCLKVVNPILSLILLWFTQILAQEKNEIKTFFKKHFGGYQSFLWGHWYPCFGLLAISVVVCQGGSLTCMLLHLHAVDSSDSPLVWHLLTSWCSAWQLHRFIHILAHIYSSIGGTRTWDQECRQTHYLISQAGLAMKWNAMNRNIIIEQTTRMVVRKIV